MLISYAEVKEKSKRDNYSENLWLHPFSARLSTFFSWLFINAGLSANQVTVIFFSFGILSAVCYLTDSFWAAFFGFVCFRLHVLFDVCDGEVARFRNQVSKYGIYWDQLIHTGVYPLILFCIYYNLSSNNPSNIILCFLILGVIGKALDLTAKNLYYRVNFQMEPQNLNEMDTGGEKNAGRGHWLLRKAAGAGIRVFGYDGFVLLYPLSYLVSGVSLLGFAIGEWMYFLLCSSIFTIAVARIVIIPMKGSVPKRANLL